MLPVLLKKRTGLSRLTARLFLYMIAGSSVWALLFMLFSLFFPLFVSCITVFRQRGDSAKPKGQKKRNRKWLSRLFSQHLGEKITGGGEGDWKEVAELFSEDALIARQIVSRWGVPWKRGNRRKFGCRDDVVAFVEDLKLKICWVMNPCIQHTGGIVSSLFMHLSLSHFKKTFSITD